MPEPKTSYSKRNWCGGSHDSWRSGEDGGGDRCTTSRCNRLNWRGAHRGFGRLRRCWWGGVAGDWRSLVSWKRLAGGSVELGGSGGGVAGATGEGGASGWGAGSVCSCRRMRVVMASSTAAALRVIDRCGAASSVWAALSVLMRSTMAPSLGRCSSAPFRALLDSAASSWLRSSVSSSR